MFVLRKYFSLCFTESTSEQQVDLLKLPNSGYTLNFDVRVKFLPMCTQATMYKFAFLDIKKPQNCVFL